MASKMFNHHADETFERAQYGPMQHHRLMAGVVVANISSIQPVGQIEINLQCAALPIPANGIAQDEFQLWAIEGTFAWIKGVIQTGSFRGNAKSLLGPVPDFIGTDPNRRPVGEFY